MEDGINYFCSSIFNAKRALEEKQNPLPLPCPEVESCDSLQDFYRKYYNEQNLQELIFPEPSIFDAKSEQYLQMETQQEEQKQFASSSTNRPTVEQSLERKYSKGPMSILWRAFSQKIPIRVSTRETNRPHSTITGTCELFDKHMNLILLHAEEEWAQIEKTFVKEKHLKHNGKSRKRRVTSSQQKFRKVERLFVKGDSIIWIQLLSSST